MLLFLPLFLKFHNSKTRSTTLLFYVAVILIFDFLWQLIKFDITTD